MKYILALFSVLVLATSCGGDEMNGLTVDEYILENGLETRELDEGVHIAVQTAGDESRKPNINSRIRVAYTGKLTDGTVFDSSTDATFDLFNLIEGWRIGVKEIGEGGSAILIVPSEAGYGSNGVPGSIPSNSTLVFDMTLLEIVQ